MWKNYICASTIEETLEVLSANPGKARIIAGGTDLILELEKGAYPQNEVIIDVSRIAGLDEITREEDGRIHLGAMVTHSHCVRSTLIHEYVPLLAEACYSVGSPQIRNRGTVVGNLVTASPANDTISPLRALDAELHIRSAKNERVVKLADFYTGVRKTVLLPDEMVVEITFKSLQENQRSCFVKYALRKAQAISLVNTAMIITVDGKKISKAAILLGAVAPTIIHAAEAEKYLEGKEISGEVLAVSAEKVKNTIAPISDIRSSADYRTRIATVIVRRGLEQMTSEEQGCTVPMDPVVLWGQKAPNHSKVTESTIFTGEHSTINTTINGKTYELSGGQHKTLLRLLREDAGLVGTKEGCAEGECGACTVFLDGVAVMSCLVPAPRADGAEITTIEGLADGEHLHPVQEAFIKEGAVQCGYCTPGFVMSAVKLFEEKNAPDIDSIKMAITGNLCRCTGYYKIVKAIESIAIGEG
jgi:xanthine dehydrogenase iron-sulfur cluster and FAD-binding subunit A